MRRVLTLSCLSVVAALAVGCGDSFEPYVGRPPLDGGKPGNQFDAGFPPDNHDGGRPGGPFCPKPDAGEPDSTPVVESIKPPAPISGGSLIIGADGRTAIAADPERDRIWAVDIPTRTLVADVRLTSGDEPGRLVQDSSGLVHVVLRRGGGIATVDLTTQSVVARRPVCSSPRGIHYDGVREQLNVACAGGELVTVASAGNGVLRSVTLDPDLRDVTPQGDKLVVTRFRSSELLVVNPNGQVEKRVSPPSLNLQGNVFSPGIAWRTVPTSNGVAVVHQGGFTGVVEASCDGYGATGNRPGIISSAITFVYGEGQSVSAGACLPANTVLPVDLAVSRDGTRVAIAAAGDKTVLVVPTTQRPTNGASTIDCAQASSWSWFNTGNSEPTAVAFDGSDRVVVLTREPALYVNGGKLLALPGEQLEHTGHSLFHKDTGKGLSCASCHPEATHDGRTWSFFNIGPRRTQSLVGGIMNTAPFHWDGDLPTLESLMGEVFVSRMGGTQPSKAQIASLGKWLDAQPIPAAGPPPDFDAIARGRALFNDPEVACASCHNGPRYTNNATVDVGTGGPFQVPQLMGLALRAPYIHNGCAKTLKERFGPCGGGDRHGHTSHLTDAQINDLVAFLETL
ncbi:MAG TPA: c-type cytochrome [Myxococcaceae bacterium]|nr:c-type cytochrome [Myxococcaceae bacterium]